MEKIIEEITFVEDEDGDVSNYNKKKTISFDQNDKPIVPDDFNGIIRETIKGRKKQIYHRYSDGILESSILKDLDFHQLVGKKLPPPETYYDQFQGKVLPWEN